MSDIIDAEHPLMTPNEAAHRLRLDPDTVRRLFHLGRLPGFQAGGSIRIRRDAVETLAAGGELPPKPITPRYLYTGRPGRPGVLPELGPVQDHRTREAQR